MNKEQEYKLMKRAGDIADDSLLASPILQSALLGSLAYFGTDYVYDKLSDNKWQESYLASIEDPNQRDIVRKRLADDRENKKKWWRRGAGLLGAALPMINNYSTISKGWSKGKDMWGGATPLEDTVGGVSGLITTGLTGKTGLKNMEQLQRTSAKKSYDFATKHGGVSNKDAMNKTFSELSHICDNLEKTAGAESNAFYGVDFKMPYVRPLSTNGLNDIPVASSLQLINSSNNASIMGPQLNRGINQGFQYASGGLGAGMVSTDDLVKSLTRVGFGYAGGNVLGSVLGTIFAQPPVVKEKLGTIGGIGGAIINSGLFR